MKEVITIYTYTSKFNFEDKFTVSHSPHKVKTDGNSLVIQISQQDVEIEYPELSEELLVNGEVEQVKAQIQKLNADTNVKVELLEDRINSLLCIENKGEESE